METQETVGGIRKRLARAMQEPDRFAIRLQYTDRDGTRTARAISPIRFVGDALVEAMCLGRESVRTFRIASCSKVRLVAAHTVLMPEPIRELGESEPC